MIISILASLVLTLIYVPMIDTVVHQVQLMVPGGDVPNERVAISAGYSAWKSDPRIHNAIAELNTLAKRSPTKEELNQWAAMDQFNSLPIWAALLVELRNAHIEPTGHPVATRVTQSRPASSVVVLPHEANMRIRDLLATLSSGPQLQIHLARMRGVFISALHDRDVDARRADSVFEATRWTLVSYHTVIRELVERLLGLADCYRRLSRPDDAVRAYEAAIVVLTDCANDSPLPDVALLAAERLPKILRALDQVRSTNSVASASPGNVSAQTLARNLENFHQTLLNVSDHDINLLPITCSAVLAKPQHNEVLRSMSAATAFLAMGWLGAAACLVNLFVIALTHCFGPVPLSWRWGIGGMILAMAIVLGPVAAVIVAVTGGWLPFIWLFSAPSLGALILAPSVVIVLIVVAGRICITPVVPAGRPALPGWAIGCGLLILLAIAGIVAERVVSRLGDGQPPINVQLFRSIGVWTGLTCIAVMMIWSLWGWRRGHRLSVRPGMRARANLAVACPATVGFLLIAAVCLLDNTGNDAAHKIAFSKAMADPIGDRLGADWFKTYFQPARNIVVSWRPSLP